MLPELPSDLKAAQDLGISFFCRRGRGPPARTMFFCATPGTAQLMPLYNYMDGPAGFGRRARRRSCPRQHCQPPPPGSLSSIDLGRGCPYQCSFCTIINVQGRKSRIRSPDDLEKIVRENYAGRQSSGSFITDDNFARNKDWEPLFGPA